MGSWNETCAITSLPITHGERVVTFVLKKVPEEYSEVNSGTSSRYAPLTIPLRGEYTDYGHMENIDVANQETFCHHLSLLQNQHSILVEGDKEPANAAQWLDAIERGRVPGLAVMMVLEPVFNAVVAEVGNRIPYLKKRPLRKLLNQSLTDYVAMEGGHFDVTKREGTTFGRFFYYKHYTELRELTADLLPPSLHPDLLTALVDVYLFDKVLEFSRRGWAPQQHGGSQRQEYRLATLIAEATLDHIARLRQDWVEENGEDDMDLFDEESILWYEDRHD